MPQFKGISIDYNTVQEQDNTDDLWCCLTQRDQMILLSALTPFSWRTRWDNLPENQDLDFVEDLASKLMINQTCCDKVNECVTSSEVINNYITTIINQTITGGGGGSIVPTEPLGKSKSVLASCSEDHVYGAVVKLVDFAIERALDFLQKLESATNFVEIIDDWLTLLFGIQLPAQISAIQAFVEWIQDAVAENFESQLTLELKQEYYCDLFCFWIDDCQGLSARQTAEYFLDRIGQVGFIGNALDLVIFLVSGNWTGTQIVDAFLAGIFGVMSADTNWIPFFNIPAIFAFDNIVMAGADEPSDDWMFFCEECSVPTWCYTFDFTVSDGGWELNENPRGTWVNGVGWQNTSTSSRCGIYIVRSFSDAIVTRVEANYDLVSDDGNRVMRSWVVNNDSVQYEPFNTNADGTDLDVHGSGNAIADRIDVSLNLRNGACAVGMSGIIKSITVRGEGANPFGSDNC